VNVAFAPAGDGATRVTYDADAVVGGMVGGVGQRMLGSVSKRMAGEFFGNVANAIGGEQVAPGGPGGGPGGVPGAAAATGGVGQVFTAPPRPASSQQDFLKGIAVGAGLVLLGVIAGGLFGRRRR
jgi:hypothetical protein